MGAGSDERTPHLLGEVVDMDAIPSGRSGVEALTDGRSRLTWTEYADRVARTAGLLADLGARPGDRIGVHLPKSVDSFVAVHAVLRLGAVMVPLDALAPPDHTAQVMSDAGIDALVSAASSAALAELAAGTDLRAVLTPEDDREVPAGVVRRSGGALDSADPAPLAAVSADSPAYIIYTSGSTGRPKGIVHTHRSALTYARSAVRTYELGPDDRLANIAPLHFDQSTFELYAGPLAGASVVVVPDGVLRFPASLSKLVAQERVTVWYSVPYVATQLSTRGALEDRDLSGLRWLLYGGEPFPPAALRRLMEQLPGCRVSNVYGPAEVNQCTYHHLDTPPPAEEPIPIGRPWGAAEVRVLADDGSEVGAGEPGELVVRTETMMDRYWEQPELTAASISTRTVDGEEQRWYHTGDLVQQREDGNFVFLGRADNQVKVRGHRVELEAVEAVLLDQPGVEAGAVVVVRPDNGDDHLVALVEPAAPADEPDRTDLLRALSLFLPRYAVPTELHGFARLPRTGTGKVDRNAAAELL